MISHQYQCIFVEVPKTGSSSIRSILGYPPKPHLNIVQIQHQMKNYWTHYDGWHNRILEGLYLWIPYRYRKHWGTKQFNAYYKFGFVRNPWDRVVSLYRRREGLQLREEMSFPEFVDWINYSSSTCLHPVPQTNQLDWFVDPHGNKLVDFIGRFENLEEDWAKVADIIGADRALPHVNKNPGKKRSFQDYYDDRSREVIAQKFKIDIETFGYTFES
jgi:hypothetical protein